MALAAPDAVAIMSWGFDQTQPVRSQRAGIFVIVGMQKEQKHIGNVKKVLQSIHGLGPFGLLNMHEKCCFHL